MTQHLTPSPRWGAEHLTFLGQPVLVYARVPSTQDIVRARAAMGAAEGLVIVADEQTTGRGRLGRRWLAPPGSSLLVSVLLKPPISAGKSLQVTMIAALAARDAIAEVTGIQVGLKWPNDLVTPPGKLAGILAEPAWQGDTLDYVVVGMGLNVNLEPDRLAMIDAPIAATSLSVLAGHPVDRWQVLRAYLANLAERYVRIGWEPDAVLGEWRRALTTLGQQVTVTTGDEQVAGLAETVNEAGALVVRLADGRQRTFWAGDVTLHGRGFQLAGELEQ